MRVNYMTFCLSIRRAKNLREGKNQLAKLRSKNWNCCFNLYWIQGKNEFNVGIWSKRKDLNWIIVSNAKSQNSKTSQSKNKWSLNPYSLCKDRPLVT